MTLKLYDYQEEAVTRMYHSESYLLADEMGLGKTVMALEEIRRRSEQYDDMKVLIITTKSAISVWQDHIRDMFEECRGVTAKIKLSRGVFKSVPAVKTSTGIRFVVTNWDQLRTNHAYKRVYWTYVICDEAHYMKNRKAKRSVAVKHIRAKFKRALTGTPIINRPDELWSILNWLFPSDYRSYWRFYENYVDYWVNPAVGYKQVRGPKNVEQLRGEIRPFTIRRLKKNVLKELPDKYYTNMFVEMSPSQRRIYNEMKKDALAWIGQHENEPVPAPQAISKLIRLRMFCCAYAEIDPELNKVRLREPSSKLDALMDVLDNDDHSIVVFSQFKQMVHLAIERFKRAGISYSVITGDVADAARRKAVEDFQAKRVRVFVATTQAGGIGLTLTAASRCVFLDRTWSPAINLQAEDRLHRIGQKNAVQIINIQARESVDQVVEEALERKWSWFRQILED